VTALEWDRLHAQICAVLSDAVALGGTISEDFVDVGGSAGSYVPRVYGRSGEDCVSCGSTLQRTIITGRGTVYCPTCQPSAQTG
jgi:formamidopyrimidine-DNA glycosylase